MTVPCDAWLQTFHLHAFRYASQSNIQSGIDIRDISISLSRIPRFLGHTQKRVVSVADHSIATARIANAMGADVETELFVLLHDAHEAYVGDMPSPLKRYLLDKHKFDFDVHSGDIQRRIHRALGLHQPTIAQEALIKKCDLYALRTERELFCASDLEWYCDGIVLPRDYSNLYTKPRAKLELANRATILVRGLHAN